MSPGYRFPNQVVKPGESVKPEDTHVVTGLNVKSVISGPIDGSSLKLGKVTVHGAAWAGEADIVKVEISTDGGSTWNPAKLGHEQSRYAWRLWAYTWNAKGGDYVLQSRATDSHGPDEASNPLAIATIGKTHILGALPHVADDTTLDKVAERFLLIDDILQLCQTQPRAR